jgi:structural maintenance of chromosome 1
LNKTIKLKSIELVNFKSFSYQLSDDKQVMPIMVGPFTEFTGILGPNGVGKSNIFDAIAYALNLNFAKNKIRHTRDLVHRPSLY